MATALPEEALYFWYKGIRSWYNDQDYLQAIEDWEDAVNLVEFGVDLEEEGLLPRRYLMKDTVHPVAPLLLFLAGCHLDAQNTVTARNYLKRCLQCCPPRSELFRLAIQEYLSSYEEQIYDGHEDSNHREAPRQVIEWAIEQGCTNYWTDGYQRPGFLSPDIPTKPVFMERQEHPAWCRVLEDHWHEIRHEFHSLQQHRAWPSVGGGHHRNGAGQHDARVVAIGEWNEWVLMGSGARPEGAPRTTHLIRKCALEDVVSLAEQGGGEVIFSILAPHTRIRPHCASTNVRLTAHLGLHVPSSASGCRIRVANQWCHWKEGKILVFDDSYEHEVENLTDEYRAVLLIRFWHPAIQTGRREKVLEEVLEKKREDLLWRYNPPVPIDSGFECVFKRGTERSTCPVCRRSGYDTIRMIYTVDDPGFECVCGQPISADAS